MPAPITTLAVQVTPLVAREGPVAGRAAARPTGPARGAGGRRLYRLERTGHRTRRSS